MQGFETFNDFGNIQIGSENILFGLVTKQVVTDTITMNFNPFGIAMTHWSIQYTGIAPICAFSGEYETVYKGSRVPGNTHTFWFASKTAPPNTPCTFYIFDLVNNISNPDNFGLECFNANAQRTYASSIKPFKMVMPNNQGIVQNVTKIAAWGGYTWSWQLYEAKATLSVGSRRIIGNQVFNDGGIYHIWQVYNPPYYGNGAGSSGPSGLIDVSNY